jgi:SAM-dependent methyltransferase
MQTGLYTDLAPWWPLLSPVADYAPDAEGYGRILQQAGGRSVLELGSGGGHCAAHLGARFEMVLTDLSPAMLAQSRKLNPACEHVVGDMRSLRLQRTFDAVFVHDAIMYMTSAADLQQALATAFVHCRPGGLVLLAPDSTRETFVPGTDHGGSDDGDRGARYLEWTHDPDPADTTYVADYAFLLRDGARPPRVVCERHLLGLFARSEWLTLLQRAGFRAELTTVITGAGEQQVFVGRRD